MSDPEEMYKEGDALLLVHVQIDFCPGGRLPIAQGDRIVPVLNLWIRAARKMGIPVYASRDWHPVRHLSFKEQGGPWPVHCVQDSQGAAFHPDLELPEDMVKVTTGIRFDKDQYSAFDETGFGRLLRADGVKRLWVGGLAQDVCVLETVLDARGEGFEVCLIREATRPVDARQGEKSLEKMKAAGVVIY